MADALKKVWAAIYKVHWGQGSWEGLDKPRSPKAKWNYDKIIHNVNVEPLDERELLFVFDQYPYLLCRILAVIAIPEHQKKPPPIVLTGTHGNGKSAFAIFFILHLLHIREPLIYYRGGYYHYFSEDGVEISREFPFDFKEPTRPHLKFIIDTDQDGPPPPHVLKPCEFWIIHITSPAKKKYSWVKQHTHRMFIMPPLPEDEVIECIGEVTKLTGKKYTKKAITSALDSFGPNMRNVLAALSVGFQTQRELLVTEVQSLDESTIMQLLSGRGQQELAHTIIRTIARPSPEPSYETYTFPDVMRNIIANQTVWRFLTIHYRRNHRQKLLEIITLFSQHPGSKASAGWLFETLAHDKLLEGGHYKVKRLTKENNSEFYSVQLGAEEQNLFDLAVAPLTAKMFLSSDPVAATSNNGTYYIPAAVNNATFDAFTLHGSKAVAFQVTLARTHSLKRAGLNKLQQRFKAHTDKNFVFVVPAQQHFRFNPGAHKLAKELAFWIMEIDISSPVFQPLAENWGDAERDEYDDDDAME